MGNRLSKIVTRTGDTGTTGLGDGTRIPKDAPRVEAIGTVDELNSTIGWLAAAPNLPPDLSRLLLTIQHDLFDLGGELAVPGYAALTNSHVEALEQAVERYNETLPPLKEFILPGGTEATARCHIARSIARRAERRCWTLVNADQSDAANTEPAIAIATNAPTAANSNSRESLAPIYLNRLSDLLFVLARVLARADGGSEILWDRNRLR